MSLEPETDTPDTEDIPYLHSYLLPSPETLSSCRSFGMHYRKCLFDACVKQPSPCCAASALAGAINALAGKPRSNSEALDHHDTLALYRRMYEEKLSQKVLSFERQIGGSSISVLSSLSEYIRNDLQPITKTTTTAGAPLQDASSSKTFDHHGRKSASRSKSVLFDTNLIQRAVNDLRLNQTLKTSDDVMKVFLELTAGSNSSNQSSEGKSSGIRAWDWEGDILGLLKAIKGYRLLSRADKPSTSPIGNGEFLAAATRVSDSWRSDSGARVDLRTALLMGQTGRPGRSKVEIPISRADDDDEEVLRVQWNRLKYE